MTVGSGAVTFTEQRFISSTFGTTASSAHNPTVWNSSGFEELKFTSQRKMKKNIKLMDPALSEGLYDLQLRTFDIKKEYQEGHEWADLDQHGMIADEVHKVFGDQAASPDENGEPTGWSDRFQVVMLISEAQKTKREMVQQRRELNEQQTEIERLKTRLILLEDKVAA
jgi:hypothetical protein